MIEPVIIGDAALYLGDCREVLPTLPRVDAVITDPPWGVDGTQRTVSATRACGKKNAYANMVDAVSYVERVVVPAITLALGMAKRGVVFPGNRCLTYYPPPRSFGCFFQPASVGLQPWGRADSQPIFYYGAHPVGSRALPGQRLSHLLTEAPEINGHPCPKPIRAMEKILDCASLRGETILDPFMGSGTTGVAAMTLGRKFIGIENSGVYFEIACRRIEDAQRQTKLFPEEQKNSDMPRVQTQLLSKREAG